MIYYDEHSERIKEFKSKVINFILSQLTQEEKRSYEDGEQERKKMRRNKYVPDLILPKGCKELGLPLNSVVEIKYGVSFEHLERVYSLAKRTFKNKDFSFVLIYHLNRPNEYFFSDDKTIIIIRDTELFNEKNEQQEETTLIPNDEERLKNCAKALKDGNCTLFIGAGVGISAGLPKWTELLDNIKDIILREQDIQDNDISNIRSTFDNSTIAEARYLRILSESKEKFYSHVRKALYANKVNTDDKLLLSIAKLVCYPSLRRKVQKIITYNFDDLLEYVLSKKGGSLKPQIVYEKDSCIKKGYFPIIHIHGVLQKFFDNGRPIPRTDIVFSEETYHDLYNQPYSWANIEQMQALRSSTCIFIGLSMNDPNLRRLLEVANKATIEDAKEEKEKKRYHYAFLKREIGDAKKKVKHEEIMDKMFLELGVQVIWFDKFKELPDKLNSLIDK